MLFFIGVQWIKMIHHRDTGHTEENTKIWHGEDEPGRKAKGRFSFLPSLNHPTSNFSVFSVFSVPLW